MTLSVQPRSIFEGSVADVTVTATLQGAPPVRGRNAGSRDGGAAADTAVSRTAYKAVAQRSLTNDAGQTTGTTVFRLETIDKTRVDAARTVSVLGSTTEAEVEVERVSGGAIALRDDDRPGLWLTPEALTVVETQSDVYTVVLQTRPASDVTVTITGAAGDLSIDDSSLLFGPGDWSAAQTATVTAADDSDSVQDADVTLTHAATEGLRAELVVSIRRDDASLVFRATALSVPEGGRAAYTVALAAAPSTAVTVEIGGVSSDLRVAPTKLEFATGNWAVLQTVTVAAEEDEYASSDPAVTLTHTASGG